MTKPTIKPASIMLAAAGARRIPLIGAGVALAVLVADQISKYWILYVFRLPERGHVELSPIMDLTMVWNRGVSFGLLQADSELARWLLTLVPLVVAGFLAWWLWRAGRVLLGIALGLVIGGAIGNVIDRALYGAVADFLDFSDIYFPYVFNVADAAISVGVAALLLDSVIGKDADAPAKPSGTGDAKDGE